MNMKNGLTPMTEQPLLKMHVFFLWDEKQNPMINSTKHLNHSEYCIEIRYVHLESTVM